jgi:HSP20 family molecular chaperone IbpA
VQTNQPQSQNQNQSVNPAQRRDGGAKGGEMQQQGQRRAAAPGARPLRPPVDVIEDAGGITLFADMPGVSKERLQLRLETDSLIIEGELSMDLPGDMESRYAEVQQQFYQRTFSLSKELDAGQATAELKHGVLKVRIPKTQQAQPKKIQITSA